MRPNRITIGSYDTADADGIAASQTPLAAGNLTINGALASGGVASLDVERNVIITSAGDDSGRTFTIYGTRANGEAFSEKLTGANAGAAKSQKLFKTVTRIAVDAATAGAVTAGTVATNTSNWIPVDKYQVPFNMGFSVQISSGATLTYQVEHTFDDVFDPDVEPVAFVHEFVTGKTANDDGNYAFPFAAMRLSITAYTSGSAKLSIFQAG